MEEIGGEKEDNQLPEMQSLKCKLKWTSADFA